MNRFIQKVLGFAIVVFCFPQPSLGQEQNDPQTLWGRSIAHFDQLDAAAAPLTGGIQAMAPYLNPPSMPNYVVVFCDDLGWGDVGVYGHPTIRTPNLDRLASEGQKWTNFYAAAPVCTPSRAGILTGRLPIRSGMASEQHRVLFPESKGGLPESEITFAQLLKAHGYRTACIGKWHLGHQEQFMPYNRGFDYFYGLKYSNDMDRDPAIPYMEACENPELEYFQLELMRNREVIQKPAYQPHLTKNYTAEAVQFIEENHDRPFLLYLAHSMPHVPLYRSEAFAGTSRRGTYGDVIEELDWSVGKIMEAIEANGLGQNTIVVFTSDNGPWLTFKTHGGSAGLLKDGKGSTYEGGMRVPALFWGPGIVTPQVVMDIGSTLDLFATFCSLSGIEMPTDRLYDSYDLAPILTGRCDTAIRTEIFYYRDTRVFAVRKGKFKAHFATKSGYGPDPEVSHDTPLLYDLEADPAEQFDIAAEHPAVVTELSKLVEQHQATVVPVVNQLNLY